MDEPKRDDDEIGRPTENDPVGAGEDDDDFEDVDEADEEDADDTETAEDTE